MRALQEAIMTAKRCGIDDFNQMLADHLTDGYVICTPDTFICAMETWRDFGESYASPGWFVTLAVGNIAELCRIDPNPDDHKWIGYVRHEGDDIRWVDYQRLRKKILHLPESQK
jgi:hypothetical protein